LAQSLQAEGYDLAVCLHASFRSALLGWLSGAEQRSVRNHSGRDWFVTLPSAELKEPKSIIQRDFDALRALGLKPRDTRPRMAIPASARAAAAKTARRLGLKRGSVLIFPGAGKPEKMWPMNRFVALARALRGRRRSVAFLNAPGEASLGEAARSAGARHAQIGNIKELGALAALCGWALGNDSGPRHLAAASGAKTFTLFGPEQLREWHPYEKKDGHWALRPESGKVEDLSLAEVQKAVGLWLR
jgi:ADP-heptose:LPS heptosyltransferase